MTKRVCQNNSCGVSIDHKQATAKTCSKRCQWTLASRRNYAKKEASRKIWRLNNPDKVAEYKRKTKSRYGGAYQAKRRAVKKSQYYDLESLKSIYSLCSKLNTLTSSNLQVDHIEPLNHKDICGLESKFNMQLLDSNTNLRKSNLRDYETHMDKLLSYDKSYTRSYDARSSD